MLLQEARKVLNESKPQNIVFVGKKPWNERIISHTKLFLFSVSLFAATTFSNFNEKPVQSNFIANPTSINQVNQNGSNSSLADFQNYLKWNMQNSQQKSQPSGIQTVQNPLINPGLIPPQKNDMEKLLDEYSNVDFKGLENARDVSKAFVGINNFIALASEMEGFRGDLHKDPATGLNIGFGYNISKRIVDGEIDTVKQDLIAIGIDKNKVDQIITMAQAPQSKIAKEIQKFNASIAKSEHASLSDAAQLISVVQGIALLKRTQGEYQQQAQTAFSGSFDKMGDNQKEVLTYAAYKAGASALSKYHNTIHIAEEVYSGKHPVTSKELGKIAKGLTFYYHANGQADFVLDERAMLIAYTFVNSDYLAVQVGRNDKIKTPMRTLIKQKLDFSSLIPKNDNKDGTENNVVPVAPAVPPVNVSFNNSTEINSVSVYKFKV